MIKYYLDSYIKPNIYQYLDICSNIHMFFFLLEYFSMAEGLYAKRDVRYDAASHNFT